MNNRDVAIAIYNRLNRYHWSHGALTDFAVGIIEDELDMAFSEYEQIIKNTEIQDLKKILNSIKIFGENLQILSGEFEKALLNIWIKN